MAEVAKAQVKEAAAAAAIGVKERTGVLARPGREERVHAEFFGALRKRAEDRGYHATWEKWAAGDVDEAKIDKNIAERVGGRKVSEKTGKELKPTKKVNEARGRVKDADELTRTILETPLAEVADGSLEQGILIEAGKLALGEMGKEGQFLIDSYAGDPAGLDALIWDGLKNLDETGEVRGAILKKYQEVHNSTRKVSEKEQKAIDKVAATETALAANKTATEANTTALEGAQKELETFNPGKENALKLTAAETKYNDFFTTKVLPLAGGKTQAEMEAILANKGTIDARVANAETKLKTMAYGNPARAAVEARYLELLDEQALTLSFGGEYDAVSAPKNALEAQKTTANDRVTELTSKGVDLINEKDTLDKALHVGKADIESARLESAGEYVKASENVLVDAIAGLYNERYEDSLLAEAEAMDRAIAAETDPAKKAIKEQIRNGRWRKIEEHRIRGRVPGLRGGKGLGHGEVERLNRGQIQEDIKLLTKEGGDKLVAAQMLRGVTDPVGNRIYSDAQIKDIVDADTFKGTLADIKTDLVARAIQTGELRASDKEAILAIYGDGALDAAIEKHKTFIEGEKKRLAFIGKTKDFVKSHPQLTGAIILTLAFPQFMTLGWGFYGLYKLFPRGGHHSAEHGAHGAAAAGHKKDKKHAESDHEEEEREKHEGPIDLDAARSKRAASGGDEDGLGEGEGEAA